MAILRSPLYLVEEKDAALSRNVAMGAFSVISVILYRTNCITTQMESGAFHYVVLSLNVFIKAKVRAACRHLSTFIRTWLICCHSFHPV